MTFDLAAALELTPDDAVAALRDASSRLLLPVDLDRFVREHIDGLDPLTLIANIRTYLEGNGWPPTSSAND